MGMCAIQSEGELISIALALLGARSGPTDPERACTHGRRPCRNELMVRTVRHAILSGGDPLGEAFAGLRSAHIRRAYGATYTPEPIIEAMLTWARNQCSPSRIVDPGAGSGRFLVAASQCFPNAQLVGIEVDPVAALMLRANLAVHGLHQRASVIVQDYRSASLGAHTGTTLFVGNPPYVRHHGIPENWKQWLGRTAAHYGVKASKLAGLHIHFFVRTLQLGKPGDWGVFVTSAEWLDVNYGATLRHLLADGLGGIALHVLDPTVRPFADAATTGAITCFRIGCRPDTLRIREVKSLQDLKDLQGGRSIPWNSAAIQKRWSVLIRPNRPVAPGSIELGEVFRVHRGQVTGNNRVWIAGRYNEDLPESVLVPSVTKARELFAAGESLTDATRLCRVVDLPANLDEIADEDRPVVKRFLQWARQQGADQSYIARHRRPWWSVRLREPAPILCTYMARRPPAFVRNLCAARHLNIAHGLYPRQSLAESVLNVLATWLRTHVKLQGGRVYAGGLTKFEPRELERVAIPRLESLPQ